MTSRLRCSNAGNLACAKLQRRQLRHTSKSLYRYHLTCVTPAPPSHSLSPLCLHLSSLRDTSIHLPCIYVFPYYCVSFIQLMILVVFFHHSVLTDSFSFQLFIYSVTFIFSSIVFSFPFAVIACSLTRPFPCLACSPPHLSQQL